MAVETLGSYFLSTPGWEVQRTNNFEIAISGVGEQNRLLILSVVSGSLPSESNEVIQLDYGNTMIKVAGKYSIQSGQLTVRDYINKDTEAMIEDWRSQVFNKNNDAVGFAAAYKKQARITQFAPDGSYERVWIVEGVWPSSVDYGQLDQSNSQAKQINITLEYDKAYIERRYGMSIPGAAGNPAGNIG